MNAFKFIASFFRARRKRGIARSIAAEYRKRQFERFERTIQEAQVTMETCRQLAQAAAALEAARQWVSAFRDIDLEEIDHEESVGLIDADEANALRIGVLDGQRKKPSSWQQQINSDIAILGEMIRREEQK